MNIGSTKKRRPTPPTEGGQIDESFFRVDLTINGKVFVITG